MDTSQGKGYSARVAAQLVVGDCEFNVASVGPGVCRLRDPQDVPPSDAKIMISIDGDKKTDDVFLPDGISADNCEVRYEVRAVSPQ
jgi:hypothetical protein